MNRTVFFCMTSLAVFGVSLAVAFLSFNLYYRRYKFIKLSSPNLNNFAVVGCVLVYVAIVLLGTDHGTLVTDSHFSFICTARAFLLSGGFSLAFGCMFIKTYRVYHIFIRASTGIVKSKLLHDQQLLGIVSVLVLIDCVIITLWVTVDPMERHLRNLTMQVSRTDRNVVYQEQREQCHSVHMVKWLGALYIYKGLLLVVGCYMAWETRHVKIPALNDSQYIGMSVYNVVITSVIVVALANVIPVKSYTLTFVLVAGLIFISTTTTLCLLFVPKIHTIWRNQEGDAVVATPGVKVECNTRRFVIEEPRECVYRAEVLNRALLRDVMELDQEITRLSCIAEEVMGVPLFDRHWPPPDTTNDGDDSDDSLPPWISEYRDHSSVTSDITPHEIWLTANDRVVSSMSNAMSVHPSPLKRDRQNHRSKTKTPDKSDALCEQLRGSLPTIATVDCGPPLHHLIPLPQISRPVRCCLSDRAINKCRVSDRCLELSPLKWLKAEKGNSEVRSESCLPSRKKIHHQNSPPLTKYPSCDSTTKGNFSSPCCGSPVVKGASLEGARSLASENTVSESVYTTAPLYCSTSFSTPEEFTQSAKRPNGAVEDPTGENGTPSASSLETDTATGDATVEDNTGTSCATTVVDEAEPKKEEEKQRQLSQLRNQIFQLERDLILLQIDNSASIDL